MAATATTSASAGQAVALLAAWAGAVAQRAGTALIGGVREVVEVTATSLEAPPGVPFPFRGSPSFGCTVFDACVHLVFAPLHSNPFRHTLKHNFGLNSDVTFGVSLSQAQLGRNFS